MSAFPLHYTLLPIFPSGTCGELWAEATGGLSSIGCRFPAQRNAGKSIKGRNSLLFLDGQLSSQRITRISVV